jgi:hypothetical protein
MQCVKSAKDERYGPVSMAFLDHTIAEGSSMLKISILVLYRPLLGAFRNASCFWFVAYVSRYFGQTVRVPGV